MGAVRERDIDATRDQVAGVGRAGVVVVAIGGDGVDAGPILTFAKDGADIDGAVLSVHRGRVVETAGVRIAGIRRAEVVVGAIGLRAPGTLPVLAEPVGPTGVVAR